MIRLLLRFVFLSALSTTVIHCGDDDDAGESDTDTDTVSDTDEYSDSDSDGDTDTDSDTDGDTDSDSDTDTDTDTDSGCDYGGQWLDCTDLPPVECWQPENDTVFDPELIWGDPPSLTYVAATSTNPIPWTIHIGEGALFHVFLPPGVSRLYMGINGPCFAASQSIRYMNYGEFVCDEPAPDSPDFASGPGEWLDGWGWIIEGGGFTPHDRYAKYENAESCLFIGFYNEDNLYAPGATFEGVGFTYEIGDMKVFLDWAN